jgi:hypothetical protein
VLITASVLARLVSLHGLHPLNWDEIEFFRATNWVREGLVPYRDFWEHHTPLQWFLFAPVTALIHSPGVGAIVAMRWAQLPLWIAVFALVNIWMRGAGIAAWARWAAMAVPLTSSLFMLPAVEYRVDVLAGALLLLGLVFVQRLDRAWWTGYGAGAAFCLSGFANLRSGPVLVLAILLVRIVDMKERRWRGNPAANRIIAGAALTFALCSVYFVATGSARIALQRLWHDNYLADRLAVPAIEHPFLHRIASPFGVRLIGMQRFAPWGVDPAGIVVELAIVLVVLELIRRRRAPDPVFFLAFVLTADVLFIAAMKFVFNYHLEMAAVLTVPFLALAIERFELRRGVAAILIVTALVNVSVAVFRGKEDDTTYQNLIMTEVDRRTLPGSAVWDSVGWALHRQPAYRYWLLRMIAVALVIHHEYEPYTPGAMAARPPAAVVADHSVREWLFLQPDLRRFVLAHYLPAWRDLWLPGLSVRLSTAQPTFEWIVPADGTYRVYASRRLALHPWFRSPLYWYLPMWRDPRQYALVAGDALTVGGAALEWSQQPLGDTLVLMRSQRLRVTLRGNEPVGVFVTRNDARELFHQPPPGITLEGAAEPRWHVPHLGYNLAPQ